jgi:TonB family protein
MKKPILSLFVAACVLGGILAYCLRTQPVHAQSLLNVQTEVQYRAGENGVGKITCEYCPRPAYSHQALEAKLEGDVSLDVLVLPTGRASRTHIKLLKSLGLGLDEQAIKRVRTWRFRPATGPDGKPVAAWIELQMRFELQ